MKYKIQFLDGPSAGKETVVRLPSDSYKTGDICQEEFKFKILFKLDFDSLLGAKVFSDFAGEGIIVEISEDDICCDFKGWTFSGSPDDLGKPGKPQLVE